MAAQTTALPRRFIIEADALRTLESLS